MSRGRFDCATWAPSLSEPGIARAIDVWLEQLADEAAGLRSLEHDRGNRFWTLAAGLQAELLAELVRDAPPDDALLAADVARMTLGDHAGVAEALAGRAADGDPRWTVALAKLDGLEDWAARSGQSVDAPLRPGSEGIGASDRSWERPPRFHEGVPLPAAALGLAASLALALALLLAARLRPQNRGALFRGTALTLGGAALFAVELLLGALDLPGDGRDPWQPAGDVLEEVSIDGEPWLRTTGTAGRYQMFPAEPTACRVVVVGGSSVHGSYYLAEDAFPAVLERRLGAGGTRAEVINLGVGGATSSEVRAGAEEALRYGVSVLVLYLGNNDLEHLTLLADFADVSPAAVGLQALLERSRIATLLRSALGEARSGVPSAEPGQAFLDDAPLEGARLEALLALAEDQAVRNMRAAIGQAGERGVAVVVANQGQNQVLCPPGEDAENPRSCFNDRLERIAERAAAGTDAVLVDVRAALREAGGGRVGHDLVRDHIHPSQRGHAVLGEALAPTVARLLAEGCGG